MRNYLLYFILLVLIFILNLAEPLSTRMLGFDRELIAAGEVWRLLTAHFVHLSVPHFLGNAMALVLLGYVAGSSLNNTLGLGLLVWCCAVVGLGLYAFAGYLQSYVGLSGVLHGLLLVAPFVSNAYSKRVALLFLLLIVGKVLWEQSGLYDDMAMANIIGGRVEANAHALGVIAGSVFLLVYAAFEYGRKKRRAD